MRFAGEGLPSSPTYPPPPRWGDRAHSITQTALRSLRQDNSPAIPIGGASPNGLPTPSLHSSCPLALRRLAFLTVPTQQNQPKRRLPHLPRLRALMKWSGVTLCVLLFALWLASGWWGVTVMHLDSTLPQDLRLVSRPVIPDWEIWVVRGSLEIAHQSPPGPPKTMEWRVTYSSSSPASLRMRWMWWPQSRAFVGPPIRKYWIPFWMPLALAVGVTIAYWYFDYRRYLGRCAICRYDLRGLPETTMKCPECGTEIASHRRIEVARG